MVAHGLRAKITWSATGIFSAFSLTYDPNIEPAIILYIMSIEIFQELLEANESGSPRVVATVSETTGSTPRSAGATMLIRPDGSMVGTIGGGCGEAEVWQGAMDTMQDGKPRTIVVDLTEPTEGDDKICGGVMHVFVEQVFSNPSET